VSDKVLRIKTKPKNPQHLVTRDLSPLILYVLVVVWLHWVYLPKVGSPACRQTSFSNEGMLVSDSETNYISVHW